MVFLGLIGFVLDRAFQRSAEQAAQESLVIHLYGLVPVSDESDGELFRLVVVQLSRLSRGAQGSALSPRE